MKPISNVNSIFFYGLVLLAVASRLLPHPPNFTPFGALGLFVGAYAVHARSWILPVLALFISDLLIGLYNPAVMGFVYSGFFCSLLLGRFFLAHQRNAKGLIGISFVSAVMFFVLSNLGVWMSGQYYPMTTQGLLLCFEMAIPFFGNTIAGNLIYTLAMFGVFEFSNKIGSNSRLAKIA